MRRYRLETLFLIQTDTDCKFRPSVFESTGLRIPSQYLTQFSMYNFGHSNKNCPPARCLSAANVVCRQFDNFKPFFFCRSYFVIPVVHSNLLYFNSV
jgi:hypothetical protein